MNDLSKNYDPTYARYYSDRMHELNKFYHNAHKLMPELLGLISAEIRREELNIIRRNAIRTRKEITGR